MEEKTTEEIAQELELRIKEQQEVCEEITAEPEIEQERANPEETYAREKAKAEVSALAEIAQDPTKALQTKLNQKVAEHIDSSEVVAEKISKTADKLVEKGLQAQENKASAGVTLSEDEMLEADYQKNKDEYLYHGINHKIDKKWKQAIVHTINDIWFVIWALVSFFTIVPVSTFLSRLSALKGFVKGIGIIVGILLILVCLGGLTYGCLKWTGVI